MSRGVASPGAALFMATFAAQSTAFVLAPMLPRLAATFAVPMGTVGQLRTCSGAAAMLAPIAVALLAPQVASRSAILAGLLLDLAGCCLAGTAGSFSALVVAHLFLGAGLGLVVGGSLTASADWAATGGRARLLTRATLGMGTSAVVATPLAGSLVMLDWRVAWLVPGAACLLALRAVRSQPGARRTVRAGGDPVQAIQRARSALRRPDVAGWLVGEFLAYGGWSVVTVFAAALLIANYRVAPLMAGMLIGLSATAFLVSARWMRPRLDAPRPWLLGLSLALAATGAAFGLARTSLVTSAVLLLLLGLLNGGRNPAGSALGLVLGGDQPAPLMAARTSMQFLGYLVGAGLGSVVLTDRGFSGLGVLMGALFGLAAVPHALAWASLCHHARPTPHTAARPAPVRCQQGG
ncbi:MAG: MFS transporter [Nocardioides sp.]